MDEGKVIKIAKKLITESGVVVGFKLNYASRRGLTFHRTNIGCEIVMNPSLFILYYSDLLNNKEIDIGIINFTLLSVAHELGHCVCPKMQKLKLDSKINLVQLVELEISGWQHAWKFIPSSIKREEYKQLAYKCITSYAERGGAKFVNKINKELNKRIG